MRDGRLITTHDVFGVYKRDGSQNEMYISDDQEIVSQQRPGDQYFIKAIVGDGGNHSIRISKIRVEINGKVGSRRGQGNEGGYSLRSGLRAGKGQ